MAPSILTRTVRDLGVTGGMACTYARSIRARNLLIVHHWLEHRGNRDQNFYIIQHGIRLSGMPAWKQSLSDQQIWQLTTFLSHMISCHHRFPNCGKLLLLALPTEA